MNHETWIVPAPLLDGAGWRIWYSQPGTVEFTPQIPTVLLNGRPQVVTEEPWACLPEYPGLRRRMGVRVIRIDSPDSQATYDILIPETPLRQYRWKTFPTSIGEGVSFVLGSCYWLPNDKEGSYGAGVRELHKTERPEPAFNLLIGDQVYQDWPPNLSIADPVTRMAQRYDEYWGHPAYQEVLTSAPNFFTCDDHEFWNGFPERAPSVPTTWTREWRERNAKPALDLFHLYQTVTNEKERSWFEFKIGQVSFFVTDSRSERSAIRGSDPHFFGSDQWTDLETWADSLTGPGVLVLGQPFFAEEKGFIKKGLDPSIQNFEHDFARLSRVFETAISGGSRGVGHSHDVLILTGDIHRARHFRGTLGGTPRAADVHELVSSAASRLRTAVTIRAPKPDKALKFSVGEATHHRKWEASPITCRPPHELPTADNNVAVIRMSPGPGAVDTGADQVRFTMAVYRLRAFTPAWSALSPWRHPKGKPGKVYETEVNLR